MDKIITVLEPVLNIIEAVLLLACAFMVASIAKTLVLRGLSKTKLKAQLYEEESQSEAKAKEAAEAQAAENAEPAAAEAAAEAEASQAVAQAEASRAAAEAQAPQAAAETSAEADKGKDAQPKESSVAGFVGALIYLIVFLLFIPAIFSLLGIKHAEAPIVNMLNELWNHLPNILACVVILVVGFMLAKLVRQLLIPIFRRLKIDKIQEKAGVETSDSGKLSATLAYIIYVLILIPIIITALRSLRIPAISNPAITMLNKIFDFVPSIIVAVLIVVIGNVIARFAGQITSRLIEATGLDERVSHFIGKEKATYPISRVIGALVHILIMVFFVVQSFSVLHMQTFNDIGNAVISYVPYALSAIVILGICFFAANAARNAITKVMNPGVGKFVFFAVWVIGIFMALNQLGIARSLVNMAFTAVAGAFAVAVAIAFGVGGKDFAARLLQKLEDENEKPEESSDADDNADVAD